MINQNDLDEMDFLRKTIQKMVVLLDRASDALDYFENHCDIDTPDSYAGLKREITTAVNEYGRENVVILPKRKVTDRPAISHFKASERACKCGCGLNTVTDRHDRNMELLRTACGNRPIAIVSGCRCDDYNEQAGGAELSRHRPNFDGECDADDIKIPGMTPGEIAVIASKLRIFGGIGIGANICHVDSRPRRQYGYGHSVWFYGSGARRRAFERGVR